MTFNMKAYPGKAQKLNQFSSAKLLFNNTSHNQWTQFTLENEKKNVLAYNSLLHEFYDYRKDINKPNDERKLLYEALGEETLGLFPSTESSSDRKVIDAEAQPALSRRRILAGLQEQTQQSCDQESSVPSQPTMQMFSRSCLLQSISREEHHDDFSRDSSLSDIDYPNSYDSNCSSDYQEYLEESNNKNEVNDDEASSPGVLLKNLKWIATLGVGGFGRVELVTLKSSDPDDQSFALKRMKKNDIKDTKQQQHILNEKEVMLSCDSPFIVKLHQTYQDTKYLYMLMEPCLGGELWTLLRRNKRFSDEAAVFYVSCVILALEYLHERGIVYRDLKPENILMDDSGYVKLTDFGFSRRLEAGEQAFTFCGTPEYVAPEIITKKSHDFRVDIWSLGILVYELVTGAPPFTKTYSNSDQFYVEILKGMKGVYFPDYISNPAAEIIRQCCRLSANQRPSLHTLKYFMWFVSIDWDQLLDRSLQPPMIPNVESSSDFSNFDTVPIDDDHPIDDYSDWSKDF